MKTLKNFILEELDTYRVNNLEIRYNVESETHKDYIIFKVPEVYSEDDFQIYLQDMYLNDLPGSEDYVNDFFGKNSSNVYDVLFEYEKYIKSEQSSEKYIDFDQNYDDKVNSDNDKFAYIKLINLQYVIKFDSFDVNSENQDDIQNDLITIFKSCESNDNNKWPLDIKLDEKNIKYK